MNEFEQMLRRWRNQFKNMMAQKGGGGSAKQTRPDHKMCPVCGKFNESTATECAYCGAVLQPKRRSDFDKRGNLRSEGLNPVMVIFGACAFFYLIGILLSGKTPGWSMGQSFLSPHGIATLAMGSNFTGFTLGLEQLPPISDGSMQPWRWVTYALLHGGVMHIFFNMSALGQLGPMILDGYDTRRFWVMVGLTAIGAGMLSSFGGLIGIGGNSVGFSGVLFGFLGAGYWLHRTRGSYAVAKRLRAYMIWGNVICIALTITGIFPIDNLAHLGGMFTGLGLARWWDTESGAKLSERLEPIALALCGVLLLWGLIAMAGPIHTLYVEGEIVDLMRMLERWR